MNTADLINTLKRKGLRLGMDAAGGLRCYGDCAKIQALLPEIKAHKPELLAILMANESPPGRHQEVGRGQVRCCDCRHQKRTDHPALVRCSAGRQALGACGMWWSTDQHQCQQFERPKP